MLRKNVVKTKEVLSANEAYQLFVESILPDTDLKVPLTRAVLERLADEAGLVARMTAVIDAALAQAYRTRLLKTSGAGMGGSYVAAAAEAQLAAAKAKAKAPGVAVAAKK